MLPLPGWLDGFDKQPKSLALLFDQISSQVRTSHSSDVPPPEHPNPPGAGPVATGGREKERERVWVNRESRVESSGNSETATVTQFGFSSFTHRCAHSLSLSLFSPPAHCRSVLVVARKFGSMAGGVGFGRSVHEHTNKQS